MRILTIYFKNINSLEGETRINFEQAPFANTGVFAITGPNGSGKSSILDAITLGLYGETFRFDRPAPFVMTKHTSECFSVIEFALGNEKYRSSWRVQRENGDDEGELMPAEMQLTRLSDGEVLADGVQDVCNRITAITGMNFRNFTRSIMLAQGDFAAFLNALDSERMDILENILSTDIYADYKKEANDKADHAKSIINRLKQDLAVIPLMTPAKQEACEHDLIDFKEQVVELQNQQHELKQQQALLVRIAGIQEQLGKQKKNLEEAKNQLKANQESLERIDAVQNAAQFEQALIEVSRKNQAVKQSRTALAALHDELQQLKNRLGNAGISESDRQRPFAEQMQTIAAVKERVNFYGANRQSETALWQSLGIQINDKKSELATVEAWLQEQAADELLLNNFPETGRLKKLRSELVELGEKQKLLGKVSKKTYSSLQSNTSILSKKSRKSGALEQQLADAEQQLEDLAPDNNLDDLEALKQEQQQRVKDFQLLHNLGLAHRTLTGGTGFFSLFGRKEEAVPDPEALAVELDNLRQELKREENISLALEEAVFRESQLKKMLADRRYLVDGKPCPLCGALHHPYAKYPPVQVDSVQALADQHLKVKFLKVKIENSEKQIVVAKKLVEKYDAKQVRIQQIKAQWSALSNRLNVADDDLTIDRLRVMKRLLHAETDDLKQIVALVSRYRSQQAAIAKLKVRIARNATMVERLQSSTQQLDSAWQGRSSEQVETETAFLKCQQEENELTEIVAGQLALLGEKMPAKGREDELFDRLNLRRQNYHSYFLRRKTLIEELGILTAKQAACQSEIDACNRQLGIYNNQLQGEEIIGLHLAITEKQKLIADKEQLLSQQEAEASALKQSLQSSLQTTQFGNLNELSEALELLKTRSQHERQQAELEQLVLRRSSELEKNSIQLEADLIAAENAPSPEELEAWFKRSAEHLDIARLEVQRLEKQLAGQKQLQQQYDSVSAELHHQEELFRPQLAEAERIRSESGMEFRRRVQARVAERLLSQTNAVLEKISGRYYLRQAPSEQGLALEIEDTFQGNARRLPRTLSGGESFIVSLALALGLSELANNGKSVDSLFLDEGFGNLDADSLFTVISTLEKLHTHGKIVGVISHVEAVKKRIKTQLQVVKKANGFGALKKAS